MATKVSTNTLMKRLLKTGNIDAYLKNNSTHLNASDFSGMLAGFCEKRKLAPADVIRSAQIERTYGHQLFNGTRRPSRDKVLQLALGMQLGPDDTQKLLRAAGRSALYPRLKRDAVIIYALNSKLSVLDVQELLTSHQMTPLGGISGD